MTEHQQKIRTTAFELFNRDTKGEKISRAVFDSMFELGILSEKPVLQFIVVTQYHYLMKHSDISGRSAIIDISDEWKVSEYFLRNLIYDLRSNVA